MILLYTLRLPYDTPRRKTEFTSSTVDVPRTKQRSNHCSLRCRSHFWLLYEYKYTTEKYCTGSHHEINDTTARIQSSSWRDTSKPSHLLRQYRTTGISQRVVCGTTPGVQLLLYNYCCSQRCQSCFSVNHTTIPVTVLYDSCCAQYSTVRYCSN